MQQHLNFAPGAAAPGGPLERWFHPAVAGWFSGHFGEATEVQLQAWTVTSRHEAALIAAPTGSGKTLAAFLSAINDLVVEGLEQGLEDSVHVLYISPLKALSNDIQKNLQTPLSGIRQKLLELGYADVPIRDAVRTGDTTQTEREQMRRNPPHILVTTPESLFILLTSDSGRQMLSSVRSVIVDELHAVAGSKRGAHLMLSLERLCALTAREPIRIGLSATQKPIETMAEFLMGERGAQKEITPPPGGEGIREGGTRCAIVDTGYTRQRDLALELPRSPLDAVISHEAWSEIYDRLAVLSQEHRTTLIFVNTRALAERTARHLAERIGAEHVTAHHGSLAKEHRLNAEQRLKAGQLKALVATSALELGIDIGEVDLVCQLGPPRSIAAFLQRVGRSGHAVGAVPKGRLFPLSQDDLVESAALLDAVGRGELDRIRVPDQPLDVLAQQIVAETGSREWDAQVLYDCFRRAAPYRSLSREAFDAVVKMLAEGFSTRRGRRSAHIHFDAINGKLRGRRGARLTAMTNAGVIPDQFDYEVVLSPEGWRVGTLNEDFAFESAAGDIFQLGNASYRILKVETGKVYVEDAKGLPPTIPFWLGEGPGRTSELSAAVSRLMEDVERTLEFPDEFPSPRPPPTGGGGDNSPDVSRGKSPSPLRGGVRGGGEAAAEEWLKTELQLPQAAAHQLTQYLAAAKAALTTLPKLDTIVFERFFDEAGDTHLVIHSPYGSRINRAWGLALRKRFCRRFNFELQASALEDSIILSLGPTHSFPLEEVKDYLKSASVRELLTQALLDAPMFGTRWRWSATIALALRRTLNGQRVPPQLQRMASEDLLAVVFPDQLACAENLAGEREIPDHPLVQQTIHDCLYETMDVDGLVALLQRIESGAVKIVCRELTSASPLSNSILSAKRYAFLDDGAAEERRTHAVRTQKLLEPQQAADLGRLDPAAIERVRQEAWPEPANADELHDAVLTAGFLTEEEGAAWSVLFEALRQNRRATVVNAEAGQALWVAAERLHQFRAALPAIQIADNFSTPPGAALEPEDALREILRSRLELLGPITETQLAAPLRLSPPQTQLALLGLEQDGAIMRGQFTQHLPVTGSRPFPGRDDETEWCERRLLHRIHRYSLARKRNEIQAVAPMEFMRFLIRWQGLGEDRREAETGLLAVLQQLEGFAVPAGAWETDILPARVRRYLPQMLDRLCSTGQIAWWRPFAPVLDEAARKSGPVRATPIVLSERGHLAFWQALPESGDAPINLSDPARRALDSLRTQGASFFSDLVHGTGLLRAEVEQALAELVAHGIVTCDSFAGLRALTLPASRRPDRAGARQHRRGSHSVDEAGRWSLQRAPQAQARPQALADPAVDHIARVLLRRYGVVFRKLLEREDHLPPWRELFYVYRRMEARGEIRGGRFVNGFSGEQFALPDAATLLRKTAREDVIGLVSISAADPLNLLGIVLPGEKVPAVPGNRLLFRGGKALAIQIAGDVRYLEKISPAEEWDLRNTLVRQAKHAAFVEQPVQSH
ncbi:MAG: DEAD/DEAH box helicase [Nevskiales bacterium]